MSDLTSPETIASAILEKPTPPKAGSPTPAARLSQKLAEGEPRDATIAMGMMPLSEKRLSESHDRMIRGNEDTTDRLERRDPATGEKIRKSGTPEEASYAVVKKTSELANTYLEHFNNLPNDQRKVIIDSITPYITSKWGPAKDMIDMGADKYALFGEALKDPRFAKILREKLSDLTNPDQRVLEVPQEVKDKLAEAEIALKQKEEEAKRKNTELLAVSAQVNEFSTPTSGSGSPGERLRELVAKNLEGQVQSKKRGIRDKETDLIEAERLLKRAENTLNNRYSSDDLKEKAQQEIDRLDPEIRNLKREIPILRDEQESLENEIQERNRLAQERVQALSVKQKLEEDLEEIKHQLEDLKRNRVIAQVDYEEAQSRRVAQENEYVENIKNVFGESALQYYMDRIREADKVAQALLDEDKKAARDKDEQDFFDKLKGAYAYAPEFDKNGKFKKQEIKKVDINVDWQTLLIEGPEGLVRERLRRQGLRKEEIDEKMKDTEFVTKAKNSAMSEIVRRRVQMGRFSKAELEFLSNNDWAPTALEDAISKNNTANEELSKIKEKLNIKGGLAGWIKEDPGKRIPLLMLILAGILTAGTALVALGVPAAMVASAKGAI